MSLFGQSSGFGTAGGGLFGASSSTTSSTASVKDYELLSPPEDTVQTLRFSPASVQQNYLTSGSWDNLVRIWEVNIPTPVQVGTTQRDGQPVPTYACNFQAAPKAQQTAGGPVLDLCYSDDGSKIFFGSADKTVKMWDLAANQVTQIGAHDNAVRTTHFIQGGNYQCIVTGSWDKTLKFWDARQPNPILTVQVPERVYAADVQYPYAIVCTANRNALVYQLDGSPREYKKLEVNLKNMLRSVSLCVDKRPGNMTPRMDGCAIGSVEGRVAITYFTPKEAKDNFTFKCHRVDHTNSAGSTTYQEIYPVNGLAFHPVHGTLATIGGDCKYAFWDKDSRIKLKTSDKCEQAITSCCFSARGEAFAYAVGYDWAQGHEYNNPSKKTQIFLNYCFEDTKPRKKS